MCRSRSPSPPRARYRCDPPKYPPGADPVRGVPSLARRHAKLYIPSDFCRVTAAWQAAPGGCYGLPLTHHVALKVIKVMNPPMGRMLGLHLAGTCPANVQQRDYLPCLAVMHALCSGKVALTGPLDLTR